MKGTAQGITSSTVTLAVTRVAISGGALTNATIGVPSTQVQENDWNTVAQSINKSGGAGCRKLQLKFFPVNPLDAAGAQQSCLTIAASKPFMVLDVGALSDVNASNCIPTAKVAYASQYLTPDQLTKYYPYYLQLLGVPVADLRNSVLGFNQLGYFKPSKGFKKLGVLYDTCNPALIVAERAALKKAGVPQSKIVEFNLGCPAGQTFTQSILQPAVLAFKNAGVTDVTSAGAGTAAAIFTQVAGQQNYKPQYLLASDTIALPNTSGTDVPDSANLNGAVNVTGQAYGEETDPGFKPGSGSQKCNALFRAPATRPSTSRWTATRASPATTCGTCKASSSMRPHCRRRRYPLRCTRWGPSHTPIRWPGELHGGAEEGTLRRRVLAGRKLRGFM